MTRTVDTWHGCYADSWQTLLVPEAFTHPAKMAPGLLRRIMQHCRAEGWLPPGSVVLDPFAGVGTTALQALLHGCAFLGNELEPTFFMLAEANIAKWMAEYAGLPGFGPWAMVTLGDSRRLTELVPGGMACVVGSPPYAESLHLNESIDKDIERLERKNIPILGGATARKHLPNKHANQGYGSTPGNLGNLRDEHQGGPLRWVAYGASAGQLATMTISSPPYGESTTVDGRAITDAKTHTRPIGSMQDLQHGYGHAPGQLGNTTGDTFWAASAAVLAQTYALLRPGGHAIFVCKDYIRNKQRVPFSQQWAALCQQVGLVWLHHHQASLVEQHGTELNLFGGETVRQTERMSFFRRLHTKKYPELAITHEDVLCFVKPGQGDAGLACCVSSPPFCESLASGELSETIRKELRKTGHLPSRSGERASYGATPGQLGAMPTGAPPQEAP